jgi:hypothetical protein
MEQDVAAVKNSMALKIAATRYGIARNSLRYHVNAETHNKNIGHHLFFKS